MTIGALLLVLLAPFGGANIQEDSDYWDCHVMGNQVCGPDAAYHVSGYY